MQSGKISRCLWGNTEYKMNKQSSNVSNRGNSLGTALILRSVMWLIARIIVKMFKCIQFNSHFIFSLPFLEFVGNNMWNCISCNQCQQWTRLCVVITSLYSALCLYSAIVCRFFGNCMFYHFVSVCVSMPDGAWLTPAHLKLLALTEDF